jgi:hypothetical protein
VDSTVEIRYAGVVVGRAIALRDQNEAGAFVGFSEPLPVGTPVSVKIGESIKEARVAEVIESPDPALAGMRIRFATNGVSAEGIPEGLGEEGSDAISGTTGTQHAEGGGGGGGRRRRKRR